MPVPTVVLVVLAGLAALSLLKVLFDFAAKRLPHDTARFFRFPGPLSLLAAGLLAIALLVLAMSIPSFFSHVFPTCAFNKTWQSQSLLNLALIFVGAIAFAWLIARFQKDMWEFNGFGSKIFESSPAQPDTRIGTKWLVAFFMPVLPVRSYEVLGVQEVTWSSRAYALKPLDIIHWDQVRQTVRKHWWIYGLFLLATAGLIALSVLPCL